MRLYLVRHGEAQDDIEDCYGGIADFELTELGRETAKQLAAKLQSKRITQVYTSPYKRASETAGIIGNHLHCDVRTISNLRERNSYGVLSGVTKKRAAEIFPHVLATVTGKPGDYYSDSLVLGAEPRTDFDERVRRAIDEVAQAAAGCEAVCVVTHGNVTRSVYRNILRVEGKVELDLLALTEIDWNSGQPRVLANDGVTVKR